MNKRKNKILIVVGTRPNFIKISQFPRLLKEHADKFELKIVHTGQHFDDKMSKVFFQQFGFVPDVFLGMEGGNRDTQIANMKIALERTFKEHSPDLVIAVGDVNSTAAAALAVAAMNIKLAHLESGLRSFDQSMPEELNRIITDDIADYFFVTEQSGIDNLIKEGKSLEKIFFVGNTMIDTIVAFQAEIDASDVLNKLKIEEKQFVLMTMHRPATVDSKEGLLALIELLRMVSKKYKVVFPVHPRTIKNLNDFGLNGTIAGIEGLILSEPLDYFSFQKLIKECKFIITDSGGIQEESTFLRVPCLTLRQNTERPSTISIGSNVLIPFSVEEIGNKIKKIEEGKFKKGGIPPLWDGKATERIVNILLNIFKE
ncbi:MAG: UDP-N-acetylglucosamine 2-epimerase (non-hydrolyzing) [Bacteroidetes bacterium]|nr:MAG: UDP-N-acetylglucosamine 2-epimerase (non-hydrolyzing) [Bacteroidota bacterium]